MNECHIYPIGLNYRIVVICIKSLTYKMKNTETRRIFLKSVTAASMALLIKPNVMGRNSMKLISEIYQEGIYRFKLGEFNCLCINDGGFNYPPEQFFKNVEKAQLDTVLKEYKILKNKSLCLY